jgi:hypothetical protein
MPAVSRTVLLGTSVLALVTGCPLLDVEVEVSEVCISYRGDQVEPAPAGQPDLTSEIRIDDLGKLGALAQLDAELTFVRAEIRATSGIEGFQFVRAAQVTVASGDPDAALPTVVAYACADGGCLPEGEALAIPSDFQQDAVAYLRTGSLVTGVRVQGELPTQAWSFDLDLCVEGSASLVVSP